MKNKIDRTSNIMF